jgi:hypothetical protein
MRQVFAVAAAFITMVGWSLAQVPQRGDIWSLKLGAAITEQPADFVDFACGSAGGPPSIALNGWTEFKRCRPEESGLREVYFRYDDELEYIARAHNSPADIERFGGTKTFGFAIVASALIGEDAIVHGLRIVSDPRYDANRDDAYVLKNFITARLDRDNWSCEDLPMDEGETSVDGLYIKQRCAKTLEGGAKATMWVRHLRKAGQARFDPRSGKQTKNQFESIVRLDLILP